MPSCVFCLLLYLSSISETEVSLQQLGKEGTFTTTGGRCKLPLAACVSSKSLYGLLSSAL